MRILDRLMGNLDMNQRIIKNKITGRTISCIFVIAAIILLSGCIEDSVNKVSLSPTSTPTEIATSTQEIKPTSTPTITPVIPEIKLISFTSVYIQNNNNQNPNPVFSECHYDGKIIICRRSLRSHNSTEEYYAVYNLSITNSGLKTSNFTIYDMHLRIGDQIFNTTPVELREVYPPFNLMAESATISPGQNQTGCIIFQVNSSYDRSFQLMYNSTAVISESFKRSVEALTISEHFNYSNVFNTPQFVVDNSKNKKNVDMDDLEPEDLYPAGTSYPLVWPNWVNRDTVEFYKKLDSQNLIKYPVNLERGSLPLTTITYVLSVTPNRNITVMPGDRLIIMDEGNEEKINESIDYVAILGGQTYELYSENIPQMNFSNTTIVQTEFDNRYGWSLAMRITSNSQIVVFDENQNIVIAMYDPGHFVS